MAVVEDVSGSMTRSTGVPGKYYSVFDGKLFWYVHRKDQELVVYDENQYKTTDEQVLEFVTKALKEENL